jgi:ABC-type glutathione transport system ATPase component
LSSAHKSVLLSSVSRGGGKSTLLRLVLGILKPTGGSIKFKGLEVTRMGRRRLNKMRQKIGMVYQYSALISSLSVRDNVALPLKELTDKPVAEFDSLIDEKLKIVGLADARNKMPSELSGGMKKRVGLARALMMDPEVILYDEPRSLLKYLCAPRESTLGRMARRERRACPLRPVRSEQHRQTAQSALALRVASLLAPAGVARSGSIEKYSRFARALASTKINSNAGRISISTGS